MSGCVPRLCLRCDADNPGHGQVVGRADATVTVRIADNGPGIPDDRKESVFGRAVRSVDSPGTGVGLYLVETLVGQYGGDIRVEENDPRGAVFVVELQRADQPPRE